jgi:hypothetical protein
MASSPSSPNEERAGERIRRTNDSRIEPLNRTERSRTKAHAVEVDGSDSKNTGIF